MAATLTLNHNGGRRGGEKRGAEALALAAQLEALVKLQQARDTVLAACESLLAANRALNRAAYPEDSLSDLEPRVA